MMLEKHIRPVILKRVVDEEGLGCLISELKISSWIDRD
jgi:hypothetical protein